MEITFTIKVFITIILGIILGIILAYLEHYFENKKFLNKIINSEQKINDLCHELFTVVSGSIGINKSIEDTIKIMKDVVKEYLK